MVLWDAWFGWSKLERKVDKIAKFYANDSKDKKLALKSSRNQALKDKDGEERMRDLMRQFGTIVRQVWLKILVLLHYELQAEREK